MGNISYFLGAARPRGFTHFFDELLSDSFGRVYIYNKGRSGHGQIKPDETDKLRPDRRGDRDGADILLIRPSFARRRICARAQLLDSGRHFPHTLEPKYPGAAQEIVDLGRFWDKDILRSRADEVIALADENTACHRRCRRFLERAPCCARIYCA